MKKKKQIVKCVRVFMKNEKNETIEVIKEKQN